MKPRLSWNRVVLEMACRLCAEQPTLGAEILRGALVGALAGVLLGGWWGLGAMAGGAVVGLLVGSVVGLLLWEPPGELLDAGDIPPAQDVGSTFAPRFPSARGARRRARLPGRRTRRGRWQPSPPCPCRARIAPARR